MKRKATTGIVILAALLALLLACQTTELIAGLGRNGGSPAPTRAANNSSDGTAPAKKNATKTPNDEYAFVPAQTPRCTIGDNAASVVGGRILDNGSPVEGQQVQASSGEGGEPITDEPARSDADGNYQVTFSCDGAACNGSFWLWLIDENGDQSSPFVKFVFDNQCRRGTVNFRNP